MSGIRFTFNIEKLIHALAFFSQSGIRDLTKLKAAKLLYFADKEHLLKHGRPILGDTYYCLPYGPVPSVALNEMSDAIASPEVESEQAQSDRNRLTQVLKVHKPLFWGYPVFQAKTGFDRDVFSESELDVLTNTVKRYGQCSARQLVELTHKEPTWIASNSRRSPDGRGLIPYELFFVGVPDEAKRVLELLKAEQEDNRELDDLIRAAKSSSAQHDQVLA